MSSHHWANPWLPWLQSAVAMIQNTIRPSANHGVRPNAVKWDHNSATFPPSGVYPWKKPLRF